MNMETRTTLSLWGAFLGGGDSHWVQKTGGISVDLKKTGWEVLQANRIGWVDTKIDEFPWLYVEGREKGAIKDFLKGKIYSFNKYSLSTYNIIGNVLNARDSAANQTKSLPLWGLYKIYTSSI